MRRSNPEVTRGFPGGRTQEIQRLVGGKALLDLTYEEDSRAEVDMNVVMTGKGELVEIQGTGEGGTFTQTQMNELLTLAKSGIRQRHQIQRDVLKDLL